MRICGHSTCERRCARVTTDGRTSGSVAWSPDGRRLVFGSLRDGPVNLFVQAADGTGTAERITTDTNVQFAGSWVQDGRTIVYFQSDPRTGFDKFTIWRADLNAGNTSARVSKLGSGLGARVSPDQRWLAYVTSVSGVVEAFVTTFPQQGQRWQVSEGGGQEVVWRADGRELYFRRGDRLYAVPFDPSANPPVGRATVPLEGRYFYQPNNPGWPNYDVGPDGRFLMISSEEGPGDQVQIALNWTKYLAARLAKSR